MRSSNPVLGRLGRGASGSDLGARPGPFGGGGRPPVPAGGGWPDTSSERMTVEDVVMRTIGLLVVVGAVAAAAWVLVPDTGVGQLVLFGALGVGLVLGLVISFARITNPALILAYAAVEGVLLGVISRYYEQLYAGIVVQAVIGTFGVFLGMALLFRARIIRATPLFTKWLLGALIGVVVLMAANFLLAIFGVAGGAGLGLRAGATGEVGWLPIVFSLVCIAVAALTFVLDFAAIEQAVAAGADRRFSWYASFGILVGLIWLYLEILRLIGYARR